MNIFKLISTLSLLVLVSPLWAQLSLEECQAKARDNYPLIHQYDLIEQTKEYNISNAKKAFLPQFSVTAIGGILEGFPSFSPPGTEAPGAEFRFIGVGQLNQMIWDGGITKAKREMEEAKAEIEKADLEVQLYALNDRVNNMFFGILLIDEQIRQLELVKDNLQQNVKVVEAAIDGGTAYQSDLDEITYEVMNTDMKISELGFSRKAYVSMLGVMIGDSLAQDQKLVKPVVNPDFMVAELRRPELRLFANQEAMLESQAKLNRAVLNPKISILGFGTLIQPGVDFGVSSLDHLLVGGLSVTWEIGGLYTNNNNKKLLEIQGLKINNQRDAFLYGNNLELTQVSQDIEKFASLMAQDRDLIALKTKIKEAYELKYENGVATLNDLLKRINDESRAKQSMIVHEIQYLMAVYKHKTTSGNISDNN